MREYGENYHWIGKRPVSRRALLSAGLGVLGAGAVASLIPLGRPFHQESTFADLHKLIGKVSGSFADYTQTPDLLPQICLEYQDYTQGEECCMPHPYPTIVPESIHRVWDYQFADSWVSGNDIYLNLRSWGSPDEAIQYYGWGKQAHSMSKDLFTSAFSKLTTSLAHYYLPHRDNYPKDPYDCLLTDYLGAKVMHRITMPYTSHYPPGTLTKPDLWAIPGQDYLKQYVNGSLSIRAKELYA